MSVEPCARIEVPAPWYEFDSGFPMGMAHDERADSRIAGHQAVSPLQLSRSGIGYHVGSHRGK